MNSGVFGKLIATVVILLAPVFAQASSEDCARVINPDCGSAPTAAFDSTGALWVVFEHHRHVYVSRSVDRGETFLASVAINQNPEAVYTNGENRPKIAFGVGGEIFVSWSRKTEGRFSGEIRFSRSVNGGKSFSTPVTVNDDGLQTSHRFDALQVTESGLVFISWLDKRDKVRQLEKGAAYHGAALYYAVSDDAGASFSVNRRVADHSCECCRVAIARHGRDEVAVMWRHIYEQNTRDHAFAILGKGQPLAISRATVDDWQIDACPHHGPDLAASADYSEYHRVWFSNGERHKGIYYDRFNVASGSNDSVISVDDRPGAAHPQVAVMGNSVYVLWKYFDGQRTSLLLLTSHDDGHSWSEAVEILNTLHASDHPQLLSSGDRIYVAWHSADEGYRLVEIN